VLHCFAIQLGKCALLCYPGGPGGLKTKGICAAVSIDQRSYPQISACAVQNSDVLTTFYGSAVFTSN